MRSHIHDDFHIVSIKQVTTGVALSEPPQGRGRARGTPRVTSRSEQVGQPVAALEQPINGLSGGRGVHHGGGREQSVPPTEAMSHMSLKDKSFKYITPYEKYTDFPFREKEKDPHGK